MDTSTALADTGAWGIDPSATLPPAAMTPALAERVEALGIRTNLEELVEQGYTILPSVGDASLTERLRAAVLRHGNSQMLLRKDVVFAEAVLAPELLAVAEFSVGEGFLLSQVAGSVRGPGDRSIGLHADQNWLPAPFPEHNYLLTFCWACDPLDEAAGSTMVLPGTHRLRRHPNPAEVQACEGGVAIECPAGSVAVWDGSIWHSNYVRSAEGQRVVCHITYSRMALRPVEDYSPWAEELIADHGEPMAGLLGRHDALFGTRGFDYAKLGRTFSFAKT